jgi:hypothetical protein
MRSILVDWLIEVHFRLQLSAETLFLAINYLDRFLSEAVTTRSELQLVGLTCLFVSSSLPYLVSLVAFLIVVFFSSWPSRLPPSMKKSSLPISPT